MSDIRILDKIEYAPLLYSLMDQHRPKNIEDALDPTELKFHYFNIEIQNRELFGYFIDDKLVCCIFVRYLFYEKEYCIDYVIKVPGINKSVIVETMNYVINRAEELGYYNFFIKFLNRTETAWHRFILDDVIADGRYTSFTEFFMPAMKKSSYGKYWQSYHKGRLYKTDMVVILYKLLDKYRKISDDVIIAIKDKNENT